MNLFQEKKQENELNMHDQDESNPAIKQWVKDNFPHLCIRNGKSKNHVMRTQLSKDIIPIQQKGRRVPVHLKERVENEFNKLMDQKHIIKLDKCSDRKFIIPIVTTVKKKPDGKIGIRLKKDKHFNHKKNQIS